MRRHHPVSEVQRKDMRTRLDDPYRREAKYPSNTKCPDCGLVFVDGVWRWARADSTRPVKTKRCPACLQIRDDYPSGVLRLGGTFIGRHRGEILRRVHNVEKQVLVQHPLERIYRIRQEEDEVALYTTGEHLAVRLGKALRSDFGGKLRIDYGAEVKTATVRWRRDA